MRGPSGNINKWMIKASMMVVKVTIDSEEIEYMDIDEILYGLVRIFNVYSPAGNFFCVLGVIHMIPRLENHVF